MPSLQALLALEALVLLPWIAQRKHVSLLILKVTDLIFLHSLAPIALLLRLASPHQLQLLQHISVILLLHLRLLVLTYVSEQAWEEVLVLIEALEAGVIKKVETIEEFYEYWLGQLVCSQKDFVEQSQRKEFYSLHSGAVRRCIEKLETYGYLPNRIKENLKA